jgi:hypothetical protein
MMAFLMIRKKKPCINSCSNDVLVGLLNKANPLMVGVAPVLVDCAPEVLLMALLTNSATKTIWIQSH